VFELVFFYVECKEILVKINKKSSTAFEKEGKKFENSKTKKAKEKIIFIKFAPKRPQQNGPRQSGLAIKSCTPAFV